jgi:lysophospholipase L1-like esterase
MIAKWSRVARSAGAWTIAGYVSVLVWACGASSGANKGQPATASGAEQPIVLGAPIAVTDPRVGVMGRTVSVASGLEMGYPGVTIRTCFTGAALSIVGSSNNGRSRFAVVVNGSRVGEFSLPQQVGEIPVWRAPMGSQGSAQGHTCVDLVHQTETWIGIATLTHVRVAGELVQSDPFAQRKLLFVGDSVTCGEAVSRQPTCSKDPTWWNAHDSYGALAARKLGAQYQLVCYGGRGVVRDWQGRSDTLNAPQFFALAIPDERQLPAALASYIPDAVVVSLGTNDFNLALGAFPAKDHFVKTYVNFIRALVTNYPSTTVFLTEGAIVADDSDSNAKSVLREYVKAVASEVSAANVEYLPSKHQPGDTCDSHPTDAQHVEMAADVSEAISTKLGW